MTYRGHEILRLNDAPSAVCPGPRDNPTGVGPKSTRKPSSSPEQDDCGTSETSIRHHSQGTAHRAVGGRALISDLGELSRVADRSDPEAGCPGCPIRVARGASRAAAIHLQSAGIRVSVLPAASRPKPVPAHATCRRHRVQGRGPAHRASTVPFKCALNQSIASCCARLRASK